MQDSHPLIAAAEEAKADASPHGSGTAPIRTRAWHSIVAVQGGVILVFTHAFTRLSTLHPLATRSLSSLTAQPEKATKDSVMARPTRGEDHPWATASESVDGLAYRGQSAAASGPA